MGNYSAPEVNALSIHKKTWKSLKCILLSEGGQSEKDTHCIIPAK
jgi:hypothetical protein